MQTTEFTSCGGTRGFDNPFLLYSSESMPVDLQSAMDLCLFLYYLNPAYRTASMRVVRHFITQFDMPVEGSQDEKKDLDDYLQYTLQLPSFLQDMGDDWAAYGNAFAYLYLPFDRFLVDPRSNNEYALDVFGGAARYSFATLQYEVNDPMDPSKRILLSFIDRASTDPTRIRLRLLNPRWITIRHNLISGTSRFIYRFENFLLDDAKKGRLHIVNELPRAMLQAMAKNQDFLFDPGTVFHLRAPTVSGVSNYGWGMPGTIANYRNIHQIQVYRKIDEAVGLDYMVPFRVICPSATGSASTDPFKNILGPTWTAEMRHMIDHRRRDKFAIHSLPFPVQYQEFGANGKILTPKDLLEYQTGVLLDGMGYPQELFKGTLQFMQVPTALRLFENSFKFLQVGYNLFTQWTVRRIRSYLGLPPMRVVLQRPSLADAIERKQMIFQLAATGEISRETAYSMLGIDDPVAEVRKRMEEDSDIQKLKMRMDQLTQQQLNAGTIGEPPQGQDGSAPGQGGGPAMGPGGPAGGSSGGGGGQTPGDVSNAAQDLAQYWLSIPTPGDRTKAMNATKASDPQLYSLAKQKMEEVRRQGESQGRQMVTQQAQGQQPGGAPAATPAS